VSADPRDAVGSESVRAPGDIAARIALAAERVGAASDVLLASHRRPDGDGTGSMAALALLCRARGKRATIYAPDLIPRRYKWLPGAKTAVQRLPADARFDLSVVVDCADPQLLGDTLPPEPQRGALVTLDHHASGRPFGDIAICDPSAAACAVLVARIAHHLAWDIDADAATALYVSLISDTGGFRHANTNAEALGLAAHLVERGAQPHVIAQRLEERSTAGKLRLLGAALSTLETACSGRVAILTVTGEMVDASGGSWDDTEGFVYWARGVDGVQVGVLITTARGGGVRVSMRSRTDRIDVGAVCMTLGGGGHPGAAGVHLDTDLTGARQRVIAALDAALARPPSSPPVATPT
jgi:bifunctional oligoribonuclease and PAP phosphatase NrnA